MTDVVTVGVTDPTGVAMTEGESADVAESNEFIEIVDLDRKCGVKI